MRSTRDPVRPPTVLADHDRRKRAAAPKTPKLEKVPEPGALPGTGRVWPRVVVVLVASVSVVALLATGLIGWRGRLGGAADGRAREAAHRFLDRYLGPDGRVVRLDQGNDTVSEGQAYAMLLAVALGDRRRFELSWQWTRTSLQRPDGLLSWRWHNGRVVDPHAATDADVDAAWALLLAAERFGTPGYRAEALRMAAGILDHETVTVAGRVTLVAGTWSRSAPYVLNPSYFSPRAFLDLARATGDARWNAVAASSHEVATRLTQGGDVLPPDWARLEESGEVAPTGPPEDLGRAPQYGLNAARLPVRLAADCDPAGRRIAASSWPLLSKAPDGGAAPTDVHARHAVDSPHPLGLVGASASARAAGDKEASDRLLDRAGALEVRSPSYYGAAWVALGRVLLTTSLLGRCAS